MKKEVISKCPICENEMSITRLQCNHCHIEINGEFSLSKLNLLTKEQLFFVELFLKNQGSIKAVEKELNISYPTVKKILNDVLSTLGYRVESEEIAMINERELILDQLAKKQISFEEATKRLKELK